MNSKYTFKVTSPSLRKTYQMFVHAPLLWDYTSATYIFTLPPYSVLPGFLDDFAMDSVRAVYYDAYMSELLAIQNSTERLATSPFHVEFFYRQTDTPTVDIAECTISERTISATIDTHLPTEIDAFVPKRREHHAVITMTNAFERLVEDKFAYLHTLDFVDRVIQDIKVFVADNELFQSNPREYLADIDEAKLVRRVLKDIYVKHVQHEVSTRSEAPLVLSVGDSEQFIRHATDIEARIKEIERAIRHELNLPMEIRGNERYQLSDFLHSNLLVELLETETYKREMTYEGRLAIKEWYTNAGKLALNAKPTEFVRNITLRALETFREDALRNMTHVISRYETTTADRSLVFQTSFKLTELYERVVDYETRMHLPEAFARLIDKLASQEVVVADAYLVGKSVIMPNVEEALRYTNLTAGLPQSEVAIKHTNFKSDVGNSEEFARNIPITTTAPTTVVYFEREMARDTIIDALKEFERQAKMIDGIYTFEDFIKSRKLPLQIFKVSASQKVIKRLKVNIARAKMSNKYKPVKPLYIAQSNKAIRKMVSPVSINRDGQKRAMIPPIEKKDEIWLIVSKPYFWSQWEGKKLW